MAYITQFYEWATGNTMTAARLNGNVTNIVDALAGGTKDINCLTVEIGSTTVIDNSENFISTSKYNLNADGTAIDAAGAITYGAGQDAAIYWDGTSNVIQQTTALTSTVSYNKFSHITSGTPANGIGVGLQFEVETAAGNNEIGVVLDAVTTDVTSTSEDFDFVIKCMAAGAAASEIVRFQSDGAIDIATGGVLQVNGTQILSATTLGSSVVTSSLTTVGALNSGSITSGFGSIDVGTSNIDGGTITAATALAGTISTAAQTNITSVGTLTAINIASGAGYDINSTEVLNATTLGSGVVASSLTSVGTLTAINIASGAGYDIDSTEVLNATTLGSGVVASSLTSVGTLTGLNVSGTVNLGTAPELTISSGAVTATASFHQIDTESDAASDDLNTINGGVAGDLLIVQAANSTRTVVLKHGSGNLFNDSGADFSLTHAGDKAMYIYSPTGGGEWHMVSKSDVA